MSIHKELARIQKELKAPKNQFNSFGKYNYRSCEDILEGVKPLLNGCVLTLSDDVVAVGNRVYVKSTVTIALDGESVSVSASAREAETKKGMDDSQITGTASSYARKYALNGLFVLMTLKMLILVLIHLSNKIQIWINSGLRLLKLTLKF